MVWYGDSSGVCGVFVCVFACVWCVQYIVVDVYSVCVCLCLCGV